MRILQLSYKIPYPPNDGGAYSIYYCAKSLLMQPEIKLTILAMRQKKNNDNPSLVPEDFKEKTNFEYVDIDNRVSILSAFKSIFSSRSYFATRFYSREYAKKLQKLITANQFEIIQLEHVYLGLYITSIKKVYDGKIILRAQNIEHQLWESNLRQMDISFYRKFFLRMMISRLKRMEENIPKKIDGIICLSNHDKQYFSSIDHLLKTAVIPIGADEKTSKTHFSGKPNELVYFIGSLDWTPNSIGLEWFLNKILPELKKLSSHFSIHIAGKNMPKEILNMQIQSVHIHGQVEDSSKFQADKGIMIVPLLSGGGIRVKIIEAMSLGKAIISTTKGAEGINYTHGQNILIADSPEEFAKCISELIIDEELRIMLGLNARKLFEEEYTLHKVGQMKLNFYKYILSGNNHD